MSGDMFTWPDGQLEIEYGYLDLDNHILYKKDNPDDMELLRDYLDGKSDVSEWVCAFSGNMSQCIKAFSFDSHRLQFSSPTKSTIYAVINQMYRDGEIQ